MKYTILSLFAAFSVLNGHPIPRSATIDDTTILNYALTLEHLENAFYSEALAKFDEEAFTDAGLPPFARGRFTDVAAHEQAHVDFLSAALGDAATQPCTYSFPYSDPVSFAALSEVLEGVGTSAYAGAGQLIDSKAFLTAAAVILSTEGRHSSWIASAVNKHEPWSGPFDVPLSMMSVFSLASTFITSCPETNPALPVQAFLKFMGSPIWSGKEAVVEYDTSKSTGDLNVAFFTGLSQLFAPVKDNKVMIPEGLKGTVYAVLTTASDMANDQNIIAGPAILQFNFDSKGEFIMSS